jgi:hypothetical protein
MVAQVSKGLDGHATVLRRLVVWPVKWIYDASLCHEVGYLRGCHDHKVRWPEDMRCSVRLSVLASCDLTEPIVQSAFGVSSLLKALNAACIASNA